MEGPAQKAEGFLLLVLLPGCMAGTVPDILPQQHTTTNKDIQAICS